jgi:hypothetical protein
MKMIRVITACLQCDFQTEFWQTTNEFGYFECPQALCPNDMSVLEQHSPDGPVDVEPDQLEVYEDREQDNREPLYEDGHGL